MLDERAAHERLEQTAGLVRRSISITACWRIARPHVRWVRIQSADLCHPILSHVPFMRDGWLFELKHDGFRALTRTGRSGVQLLSRSGRSMAEPFPEIVAVLERLPDGLVLDGELVMPGPDGRSDFEQLRRRNLLHREARARIDALIAPNTD